MKLLKSWRKRRNCSNASGGCLTTKDAKFFAKDAKKGSSLCVLRASCYYCAFKTTERLTTKDAEFFAKDAKKGSSPCALCASCYYCAFKTTERLTTKDTKFFAKNTKPFFVNLALFLSFVNFVVKENKKSETIFKIHPAFVPLKRRFF